MPYPLDDNGNIRVDFVWGNFPLQPDEQRTDAGAEWNGTNNQPQDRGWTAPSEGYTSDTLNTTYTQGLSVGDQSESNTNYWRMVNTRDVSVPSTHDIIKTGYSNYPAFLPDYAGDGDINFELVVPNLTTLASPDAEALIEGLGLVFSRITSSTGATADNEGRLKLQSPTAGAVVNPGSTVTATYFVNQVAVPNLVGLSPSAADAALIAAGLASGNAQYDNVGATSVNTQTVKVSDPVAGTLVAPGTAVSYSVYNYTSTATTGPVAGFNRNAAVFNVNGTEAIMYVTGRTNWPTVGSQIVVTGNANTSCNTGFNVLDVKEDDSYNTGGTAIKVALQVGLFSGDFATATGGTWTKQ